MEGKIAICEQKAGILGIYEGENLFREVDKALFRKYHTQIKNFNCLSKEFLLLEKKVAYHYAISLLAKRGYTTLELERKIDTKKLSFEAKRSAIDQVRVYLNDEKLIKALIDSYLRKGKGEKWILQKLYGKSSFSKEELKLWLDEMLPEEEKLERAKAVLKKKYKDRDKSLAPKAYRFLVGRGFPESLAYKASSRFFTHQHALDISEML